MNGPDRKSGPAPARRDQARQMLSELQRMMNNLQAGRMQQMASRKRMRQQMDKLGELMQRQQPDDETFKWTRQLTRPGCSAAIRSKARTRLFGQTCARIRAAEWTPTANPTHGRYDAQQLRKLSSN